MEEEAIIKVLENWNPWTKKLSIGIARKNYLRSIYPFLERKEVLVLKGIRRSGKSTIMKQLMYKCMQDDIHARQILYINLEDYNWSNELKIDLLEQILDAYKKHTKNKKKIFCFLDEVQKIEGWEKWIRTKYETDQQLKFIISGSSASLLSKELSTLLTGRNLSFTIRPLSYQESKSFQKRQSLKEYLLYGGFPEVVLESSEEKKRKILQQYFEDIIHKDIIERHAIKNTKQVLELAQYLISSSGSKVSTNKLSKVYGLAKDTIATYIAYMKDAYLLHEVPYFSYSIKVKHDQSKLPKYYATDNGLIQVVSIKYSQNKGQMFENSVFLKLLESSEDISYWSDTHTEVDFVLKRTAVNVTATDIIPEREEKALQAFQAKHKTFLCFLIAEKGKGEKTLGIEDFLKNEIIFS